jgi:antitoxin PrlF
MSASSLTSKGQVTIPKPVRDVLGIHAGDRVSFLVREDGVVELRPETVDLKNLYGMLAYRGKPASVEEMDRSISHAAAKSFTRSVKK